MKERCQLLVSLIVAFLQRTKVQTCGLVFSFAILLLALSGLYLSALKVSEVFIVNKASSLEVDYPLNGTYVQRVERAKSGSQKGSEKLVVKAKLAHLSPVFYNSAKPIRLKLFTNAPVEAINIFNSKHQKLAVYNFAYDDGGIARKNFTWGLPFVVPKAVLAQDCFVEVVLKARLCYWDEALTFYFSQDAFQDSVHGSAESWVDGHGTSNWGRELCILLMVLALFGILFFGACSLGLHPVSALLVLLAFGLRLLYLSYTDFATREHDHWAHLGYIQYLLTNESLPGPHLNAATIHPPLYYLAVVSFYGLANWFGFYEYNVLQFFTLLVSLAFVIGCALVFKLMPWKNSLQFLACALLASWPGLVINSVIINNDYLAAAFFVFTFYFLLCWLRKGQAKDYLWACLFCALTSFTKLIGVTLLIILCIFTFWRFVSWLSLSKSASELKLLAKGLVLVGLLKKAKFLLVLGLPAAVTVYFVNFYNYNFTSLGYKAGFQQIEDISTKLAWQHFFGFDLLAFLRFPYLEFSSGFPGRDNVWNFFWKSALFGEYAFWWQWKPYLACLLSALLVVQMAFVLVYASARLLKSWLSPWLRQARPTFKKRSSLQILYFLKSSKLREKALFVICFCLLFVSIGVGRFTHPVVSMADFRYVMPIVLPMIYLYLSSLGSLEGLNISARNSTVFTKVVWVFKTLAWLFFAASCLFFIL